MSFVADTLAALRDPASLTRRAAISSSWRLGGRGAGIAIRLGSNLIMTRLLAPDDFGVMAIVFTIHTGLVMISDVGINPAIIRARDGHSAEFLQTAWTVQIAQFSALALLLVLCGAALQAAQAHGLTATGNVYGDPDLPLLIAASATIMLARGLRSTSWVLAERNLAVGGIVVYEVASQLFAVCVMVLCALAGFGVWALIWGSLAGGLAQLAASHVGLSGPRMALRWSKDHVEEIWRVGKWLIGSSTLGFVANNGDRFLFGALLDPATFGLYAIALVWISAIGQIVESMVGPTALAALAEAQRDTAARLASVFAKVRTVLDILCLGAFAGVLLLAGPFVRLFYVEAFHGIAGFMGLMAGQALVLRYSPVTSLLLNAGRSRLIAGSALACALAMITVVPAVFFLFGLPWAVFAVAVNRIWGVPLLLRATALEVPLDLGREYAALAIVVGLALFAAAVTLWGA